MAPNQLKWRDEPVYDLEGVTRNFEQLRTSLLPGTLHGETLKGGLTGELPEPSLAKPEAWKRLSVLGYVNAWEDFEAGARHGEYRKTELGIVELRGLIKAGESAKTAFTLPAGYRPLNEAGIAVNCSGGMATLVIKTNGEVAPVNNTPAGAEVKTFVHLEPAFFSVQ